MLWSTTFFHFLADFFGAFFKPLGPILAQQLNISTGDFATLLGIASGIAALTQIFWGLLSDRCRKEGILVSHYYYRDHGYIHNWLYQFFLHFGHIDIHSKTSKLSLSPCGSQYGWS